MTPAASARRLAAASGLLLAAAVATWWLGSTRLVLLDGADASRPAAQALLVLCLLRGIALALTAPADAVRIGLVAAATAALLRLAPAWPVVVMAWSASRVPGWALLAAEAALLVAAVALPLAGLAVGRVLRQAARAEPAALALGVALVAALWHGRAAVAALLGAPA
ncbi:MAG: hypothetical protein JNM33_01280 [Rubrivivax sp.]|nr:hypothetical protein [Rubrivivax sp.]